ncbi:MAG: carbamoyl-phosphate synthase large subunit [Oscillospiraceae bacterium]|jgi:carbamoyl-phosphate synthase large subunit|nr:carbamoyl-phosphate synthase large subunit [Oscillospiraceae bacterium]
MPKYKNIRKVLIIGSGPIVIGQAAEFDYSGTQGCLALKELGCKTVLVNSNPATIMTDSNIADKVYIEPLTLEFISKIIRIERPDAILPTLGGQTALNLIVKLDRKGVLKECGCQVLGTSVSAIEIAEDRSKFKQMCQKICEPCVESRIVFSISEAKEAILELGFPLVLRPAFTLGGTGGGFVFNNKDLKTLCASALQISPVHQVLVEKSVAGFKEIEYEAIRDSNDTAITICNMENLNPVGVHTGDSIVICPSQTLTNCQYHMLRSASLRIIRELKIEGGCNIQFALDFNSSKYYVIEVNPRVSRSSALASKASGYPIAKVSAMVAMGFHLEEIPLMNTVASFEPALDYVVTKIPRFPFDKFKDAERNLNTQMKSTGEVLAFGRRFEESLLKAIRSLELGLNHIKILGLEKFDKNELLEKIIIPTDELIFIVAEILRKDSSDACLNKIKEITKVDLFFINKIKNIILIEKEIKNNLNDLKILLKAKKFGFSDESIADLWKTSADEILKLRKENGIFPVYKMIDTCAGEFDSYVPYFYSTYNGTENERRTVNNNRTIIVLGSGPIRIGQGIEFDYSTVHAVRAIRDSGYEAVVINNNPSTVSTDYSISDRLYFEPLFIEDIINIVNLENPKGVIVTLGGQTPMNLVEKLEKLGVPIIGTNAETIRKSENRGIFSKILKSLNILQPKGDIASNIYEAFLIASRIDYPVLVRPSFVLGGRAMRVIWDKSELVEYFSEAASVGSGYVLIDKYILGKELEVDAVCDGETVFCPGIIEHIEKSGVHSGDSIAVYPTFSIKREIKEIIMNYTEKLGLKIGIKGPFNVQFILADEKNDHNFNDIEDVKERIYVIEVNPRSSRTVPFISKASGINIAEISAQVQIGGKLDSMDVIKNYREKFEAKDILSQFRYFFVKSPVFSFSKIFGTETYLSPEMKSTGETMGHDKFLSRALYKSLKGAGLGMKRYGNVLITVAEKDRLDVLPISKRFLNLGFGIVATPGTCDFLCLNGVKSKRLRKISQGSDEILEKLSSRSIAYVINTVSLGKGERDGFLIRRCAVENHVGIFTSLDTALMLIGMLEDITFKVNPV